MSMYSGRGKKKGHSGRYNEGDYKPTQNKPSKALKNKPADITAKARGST